MLVGAWQLLLFGDEFTGVCACGSVSVVWALVPLEETSNFFDMAIFHLGPYEDCANPFCIPLLTLCQR